MDRWLITVAVTALFVGLFFVIRSLPDAECGFLHYEAIVNADGEVEFCATNHAGFLDLSRLEYPVELALELPERIRVGESVPVTLELETKGGMPIAPHQLAVTHTEKMHLMMIDPSFTDYHHIHPQAEGIEGRYRFEFTPQRPGTYQLFTEMVPIRTRRQVVATGTIEVEGPKREASFERRTVTEVGGYRFELLEVPPVLQRNRDYRLELGITDLAGKPAKLESIMGAYGHMVAFDQGGRGFAHMHPESSIVSERLAGFAANPPGGRDLAFRFNVPNPGWYRLFAQVKIEGEVLFAAFDLPVE